MLAGCVLPLAAAPADACAAMVSGGAPPAPFFMTTLGATGTTGFGGGVSNTGFITGAGSGFLGGGATETALVGAFGFASGFFTDPGFLAGAAFFLAGTGFFLAATGFLAGAFLGAGFLAMVVVGSELFQFPRG